MPVTLTNTSGDLLLLYAPEGGRDSFGVEDGATVTVPGAVLADEEDHYLIGPEDAEPGDEAVRAWPKANWQVTEKEEQSDA
jgi:hypothetical protein